MRKRATLIVEVDIDPVPGAFDSAEDHKERLQASLDHMFPWYNPTVTINTSQDNDDALIPLIEKARRYDIIVNSDLWTQLEAM